MDNATSRELDVDEAVEQSARRRTVTQAWHRRVETRPDVPAIAYFDATYTVREVDDLAGSLAVGLAERDVGAEDHVGIHLQNVPQYAITLLALWKLGATAVVFNPMYLGGELEQPVADSGAIGIITTDRDVAAVRESVERTAIRWIIGTDERDLQGRNDPRMFADHPSAEVSADGDLVDLMRCHAGQQPDPVETGPEDLALLTYTSGTTGPPKGAMNSHANVVTVATTFADFVGVEDGDVVLAIAPLFHITGAVVNAVLGLVHETILVFTGRFHPEVVLDAFREHRVTFTIGSITAYNAMMRLEHASAEHFASVKTLYSGGAPIPPSTVERFEERFGHYIRNGYGMTETTSGVIAVPPGSRAPVDAASGTLSIGVPLPGVDVSVVGPDDRPVALGEQGELVLTGPQMVRGYWRNPEATEVTMPGGRIHTGDGAVIDEDGWVYLVDPLKDQINTSGYKVWPREVEDVLYQHPAVFEAAVVGLPDECRGEEVTAFVSLKDGAKGDEAELPKTQTGKIRRRAPATTTRDRRALVLRRATKERSMTPNDTPTLDRPLADLLRPAAVGPRLAGATGKSTWREFSAELIAGGKSNLTFVLTSADGDRLILRRPPTGELLPSAHDMGREARIQVGLAGSGVPIPRVVVNETSGDDLGVPYYVMEEVRGHVIRDELPAGYAQDERGKEAMADALVDVLVALHAVDPDEVGLGDLGRRDGYLERQLRRWLGQSEKATVSVQAPRLPNLADRLGESMPQSPPSRIIHGDYRIDNCVYDADDPGRIRAVLDWELSTLGDPIADLAQTAMYWGDSDGPTMPLIPSLSRQAGWPPSSHLVERYCAASGNDPAVLPWYRAFAVFKFAAIAQGVATRAEAGDMAGQEFGDIGDSIRDLVDHAHSILDDTLGGTHD